MENTIYKCGFCKKKISHLKIECEKCGYISCLIHRFHECAVSRNKEIEVLKEKNPVIVPSKIDKI